MIAAFLLAASLTPSLAPAQTPATAPHYVSQRANQAYLREGPGYAYKILWIYRHKGTPFYENASFDIWRRVTTPDGAVGWMSMEMLSDNRTVLVTGKDRVDIRKDASPDAKPVGRADPGAVLKLKACGQEFCRVASSDVDGWILKNRIWGVDANEVFK
jgi:SH3-like domain-containing protein